MIWLPSAVSSLWYSAYVRDIWGVGGYFLGPEGMNPLSASFYHLIFPLTPESMASTHDKTWICSINEWAFTFSFDLDSSGWLTHVVETANAHFQVKTNLQDALSGDIHYKLMQRSKNRNKTGYLSHCPTHTQTHTSQATWYTQTHTLIMTTWINCPLDLFLVSFCAIRVRHGWKRTLVLNVPTPCTVWAEEAATWWTPSVIFRRRTSGRRRATKHVGWAWSLKRDPNTSRLLIIF